MGDNEFNQKLCDVKHQQVDKDVQNLEKRFNDQVETLKHEVTRNYQEMMEEINTFKQEVSAEINEKYSNLKNKIIVSKQSTGKYIDEIATFNKKLKGNGDPSIFQRLRNIKVQMAVLQFTVIALLYITFGGDFNGITIKSIKDTLFNNRAEKVQKVEQVIEEDVIVKIEDPNNKIQK